MSAKWMRVETDFVDHPKVMRLARHLKVDEAVAGWAVMRAWSWMSRFCPTGQVRDIDRDTLEDACKWSGGKGELLSALVSVGFFEEEPDGSLEAHDWTEHQGKVASNAEKERERKRAYRARKAAGVPEMSHGTSHGTDDGTKTGRPAQRDVTGRDVTGRKETTLSGTPDLLVPVEPTPIRPEVLEEALTDAEFQVFEHWRTVLRHPKAKPTPERKRLIAKALRVYSVDELQRAITGCSRSPHHMGENDRRTVYDDLELILRDAKHIESFMAKAEGVAA